MTADRDPRARVAGPPPAGTAGDPASQALALLQRARRALVALPLLLAGALLVTAGLGASRTRDALVISARGEGNALVHAVSRRLRPGTWPDRDTLDGILADLSESGLRCLAVFTHDLGPIGSAGDCNPASLAADLRDLRPDQVARRGDRARMSAHAPHRLPRPPAPRLDRPFAPPPPPDVPLPLVIEFQPVQTDALAAATRWSLGIAVLAALVLAGSGLALGLLTRRAGRLQERLEAERRLAVLGEMAAVMAHEIRNPLASMKGHAQLLEEQLGESTPQGAKATRLVREVLRLEQLTEDLLELARGEVVRPASADPAEVLRAAAGEVQAAVSLDLARAPERWALDAQRLRQVLGNLLRNAAQAGGDAVEAAVAVEEGRLVYRVRDHGPGVPPEERERIFEPFHTTRLRGTGLGLAVARRIVTAHGGSIAVEDATGGGAVFRVVLPPGRSGVAER